MRPPERSVFQLGELKANTIKIQNIIRDANVNTAYIPNTPKSITIGDGYRDINARPLRVLSLGAFLYMQIVVVPLISSVY